MDWSTIILGVILFYAGIFLGIVIQKWLQYRRSFNGVINIVQAPDKTVFSLELQEDPEEIALMKEVIFKVNASEQNRE